MGSKQLMITCLSVCALLCISVGTAIMASDTSEGLVRQVDQVSPCGTICAFAGLSAPAGWYLCNGDSLNATMKPQYANLYAVIGNTFGGKGIDDFKVPDFRGRFMRGFGANTNRDPEREFGSFQDDATGRPRAKPFSFDGAQGECKGSTANAGIHRHSWSYPFSSSEGGNGRASILGDDGNQNADWSLDTSDSGEHSHTFSGSVTVSGIITGGGDSETRPANVAVNFIIKL
jgi:hypothetical protein